MLGWLFNRRAESTRVGTLPSNVGLGSSSPKKWLGCFDAHIAYESHKHKEDQQDVKRQSHFTNSRMNSLHDRLTSSKDFPFRCMILQETPTQAIQS